MKINLICGNQVTFKLGYNSFGLNDVREIACHDPATNRTYGTSEILLLQLSEKVIMDGTLDLEIHGLRMAEKRSLRDMIFRSRRFIQLYLMDDWHSMLLNINMTANPVAEWDGSKFSIQVATFGSALRACEELLRLP